ncbi:hypothetical protein ONQ60_25995, partial [Salmonella enterica subsp. enterica serovar Virginia]|nr:hypothetical protein [Salmonella enterica subsp. enterica serovar Virginia]
LAALNSLGVMADASGRNDLVVKTPDGDRKVSGSAYRETKDRGNAVCELVAEADQRFGVKGSVGIGIPGMPETEDGTLYAANVPAA